MRVRISEQRKEQEATAVLPDGMERLMGIADVAAFLGVPVATVRKWNHLGTGPPSLKIGRHVKYEPSAVRQWLDGRRNAS